MLKSLYYFIFIFCLAACSSVQTIQQLPLQTVESRLFKVEQLHPKNEISLLAIQFSPQRWRWVQTDPLGAPIARLILEKSGWKNDGFIMPNAQAKQLFSALATSFGPTLLFEFSDMEETTRGRIYRINRKFVWKTYKQPPITEIELADGSRWKIEELTQ